MSVRLGGLETDDPSPPSRNPRVPTVAVFLLEHIIYHSTIFATCSLNLQDSKKQLCIQAP